MAKKDSLILLIIALGCISQTSIAQIRRDSIYLRIFEPNEKSIEILNDVLSTRHTLVRGHIGAFLISAELTADSLVMVNVLYDSTWGGCVLNDFRLQRYYGCLIYKDRLFLLDNSLHQVDSVIFDPTRRKKGFVDYGSTMLGVINDREVTWTFQLIDGKFERTLIYPPGEIFEFE